MQNDSVRKGLLFNTNIPEEADVVKLLDVMGRGMSQFIVYLVTEFIDENWVNVDTATKEEINAIIKNKKRLSQTNVNEPKDDIINEVLYKLQNMLNLAPCKNNVIKKDEGLKPETKVQKNAFSNKKTAASGLENEQLIEQSGDTEEKIEIDINLLEQMNQL